jgi:uncharacterized protein
VAQLDAAPIVESPTHPTRTPSPAAMRQPRSPTRTHRYTLCTTLRCNLACAYCYIQRNPARMSLETARQAVDFIFRLAPPKDNIEIGFFGGEPFLEFPLLRDITRMVERHASYDAGRVSLTVTTNGTVFSDAIATFLNEHAFKVCVSCDGPPTVHNMMRRTKGGKDSSSLVERTLLKATQTLPILLVNSVYHPRTFRALPQTLDYLSSLGLRRIFLNADYTAAWTESEAERLPEVYGAIADRYIAWYLADNPHFVSLIDSKIGVLLRGGYQPQERCQMGALELAITPDGGLYPCERLVGSGQQDDFRIGSLEEGLNLERLGSYCAPGSHVNPECSDCSLRAYCMNWCGCSNVFMTGNTNRVGPFLCASEFAAISVAFHVFEILERRLGPVFLHHMGGMPHFNSVLRSTGGSEC